MIYYITGDLFESPAQALVNPVNLDGIMGKGLAKEFKERFPKNYKIYVVSCRIGNIGIGKLLVTLSEKTLFGVEKIIINFPTKTYWGFPSKYRYIDEGLKDLVNLINTSGIKSIALPALGCGNGGLDFEKVKVIMERHLGFLDCDIAIYLPG